MFARLSDNLPVKDYVIRANCVSSCKIIDAFRGNILFVSYKFCFYTFRFLSISSFRLFPHTKKTIMIFRIAAKNTQKQIYVCGS